MNVHDWLWSEHRSGRSYFSYLALDVIGILTQMSFQVSSSGEVPTKELRDGSLYCLEGGRIILQHQLGGLRIFSEKGQQFLLTDTATIYQILQSRVICLEGTKLQYLENQTVYRLPLTSIWSPPPDPSPRSRIVFYQVPYPSKEVIQLTATHLFVKQKDRYETYDLNRKQIQCWPRNKEMEAAKLNRTHLFISVSTWDEFQMRRQTFLLGYRLDTQQVEYRIPLPFFTRAFQVTDCFVGWKANSAYQIYHLPSTRLILSVPLHPTQHVYLYQGQSIVEPKRTTWGLEVRSATHYCNYQ